jgi:uncharacterized membrane protein
MSKKSALVALIVVLLLATVVRLPFLSSRSLWFDEAVTWRLMLFPLPEAAKRAAEDVHPLFYYFVLRLWTFPTRLQAKPLSLETLRLPSVIFSVLTAAVIFQLARLLFRSRWTGILAALLFSFNAFQVQYATEARMYTLATLLLVTATISFWHALHTRNRYQREKRLFRFALPLAALLHTHYFSLLSVAALGLVGIKHFLPAFLRHPIQTWRKVNFRAVMGGFSLALLLFLPWLPFFLAQRAQVKEQYWVAPLHRWTIPETIAKLWVSAPTGIDRGLAAAFTLATLLILWIVWRRGKSLGDQIALALFCGPLFFAFLISLRTPLFETRFFVLAGIGLILLLARACALLSRRNLWGMAAVVIMLAGLGQSWYVLDIPSRPGVRGAAAYLRQKQAENVVVSSSFVYFPLAFHLHCPLPPKPCAGGENLRLYAPGGLLHFTGKPVVVEAEMVGNQIFQRSELWVVDTTGFGQQPLKPPPTYRKISSKKFREVYPHQGEIIVNHYLRKR